MTDHGCLMTDPMMRAVLSNDKDVTRRIGKTWARARVGDRLWFREVWAPCPDAPAWNGRKAFYRADGRPPYGGLSVDKWRSSLLMPRSVCRATGIITDIRQVPLQDIDEADAIREGMGTVTMSDLESIGSRRKVLLASRSVKMIGLSDYNWLMRDKGRKIVDAVWENTIPHWASVGPRDRFWLGFLLIHSPEIWRQNPLVWRVEWRRE